MKTNYSLSLISIFALCFIFTSCENTSAPTKNTNTAPASNTNTAPTTNANTPITNKNAVAATTPQNTVTPVNSQPTITATPIPQNTRLAIVPTNSSTPSAETLVTIEKFEKLKIGMAYQEAANILGSAGTTQGALKTQSGAMQMYSWKGKTEKGDWNITARFEKGKLVNKVQFGLK